MGSLFGSKTSSSTSSQPFSGEIANQFSDFYDELMKNYSSTSDDTYTGQLSADWNDYQQSALDALNNQANNSTLAAYASGQYIDPESNPYLQKSADLLKSNAQDQFSQTANAIDSRFNNRSFWDSSTHTNTLDRAADTANENYNAALTSLYSDAYNTGVNNMLSANSAQQTAANNLLNAGNTQYSAENTSLQNQYQAWLDQQGLNQQDIDNMLNYFNTGKNPTETTTQKSSGLGSILGSIGGGWASTWGKK